MHTTTNMNLCPDQEILDRVKKVTPKLAERAKEVDENSRFPIENYKDLHEAGLIAIAVSKDWGGAGADPVTYHLAALEIAKACGSTGLTYNMHSTVLTLIEALATEEQKKRYLGDCVENGKLFASVTSEEGTSFRHKVVLSGTWTPVDGGYLLNGSKIFSSIGENADYYFQSAFLEGKTTGSEALLTAVVPKSANGVRIEHVWNAMGMRGTATDTIIFEDTFVPQADVLGGVAALGTIDITMFHLGFSSVYLGVAEAAFDWIVDYVNRTTFKPSDTPISHDIQVQSRVAEMGTLIRAAKLLLCEAAHVKMKGDRQATIQAVAQSKYFSCEVATKVVTEALRAAGGRGVLKKNPVERFIREGLIGVVMPPSNERCLEVAGRIICGLQGHILQYV